MPFQVDEFIYCYFAKASTSLLDAFDALNVVGVFCSTNCYVW